MDIGHIAELLRNNWGYIALLLPLLIGGIGILLKGHLHGIALKAVGAIYRVAIHEAEEYQDAGLTWLVSDAGIAFRKGLADKAYDALPDNLGIVPLWLVKAAVSHETWAGWVELAFQEVVELTAKIEFPLELEA